MSKVLNRLRALQSADQAPIFKLAADEIERLRRHLHFAAGYMSAYPPFEAGHVEKVLDFIAEKADEPLPNPPKEEA